VKRTTNLGLVTLVALLLTMLAGVPSASASRFLAGSAESPAAFDISGVDGNFLVSFNGITYGCEAPQAIAAVAGMTATLTPSGTEDSSCEKLSFPSGEEATLEMDGCSFIYRPGSQEGSEGHLGGTYDIGPANCGPVVLDSQSCVREFSPQSGKVGSAEYSNVKGGAGHDAVRIDSNAHFEYTRHGGCGTGTFNNGAFDGSWLVQSDSTGIRVEDDAGLYMGGKGFEAEEFPVSLTSPQESGNLWSFAGRTVECGAQQFLGELSGPATTLSLDSYATGCTALILGSKVPASVSILESGCHYVFNSAGTMGVACQEEGQAIEIKAYSNTKKQEANEPLCTYRIGAQTGASGVSYSTVGEGLNRKLEVDLAVSGLTYTVTVGNKLTCGNTTYGASHTGGATLAGTL